MKPFKFSYLLIFTCLISLCSCDSCDDDTDLTTLPPETQTGANTFGCYVNGELFVNDGKAPYMHKSISAEYQKEKKRLIVDAYSNGQYIYLELNNPQANDKPISIAYFSPRNFKECFCFGGENIGEITLTKFDIINKIVSGRFRFEGRCSDELLRPVGDSIVKVTDGRFDIKLEIFE